MNLKIYTLACLTLLLGLQAQAETIEPTAPVFKRPPNIVLFYVDDLGYADVGSYGAVGVKTPNVDKLAAGGIRFTDAHSPAATCTPSRYSLLTGRYAFRNKAEILPGDAPLVINPQRPTLPKMLQRAGYRTAVVGKWHLGLGDGHVDWNQAVKPGPLEIGFDYSFLMPATGDRVPTVYLENHDVVGQDNKDPITVSYEGKVGKRPVGRQHPGMLKQQADDQHSDSIINGISRIGYMAGGKEAEWVDEDFPFVFTDKAIEFIRTNGEVPFFLYFPFHDIHVPRVPNAKFQDTSEMGIRGDVIAQMDWMTGRIMDALEEDGLLQNTLVIFTSDNGPVLDDGYADGAVENLGPHNPSGPFNGGKYSAFEAGTRVPMITYFKALIEPGTSEALFSHIDFYASLAGLVGVKLEPGEAPDSENVAPALFNASAPARDVMLEEAFTLALRQGRWKYIAPFKGQTPGWLSNKTVDAGLRSEPQLFNLDDDIGETRNLAGSIPEKRAEMEALLDELISEENH